MTLGFGRFVSTGLAITVLLLTGVRDVSVAAGFEIQFFESAVSVAGQKYR